MFCPLVELLVEVSASLAAFIYGFSHACFLQILLGGGARWAVRKLELLQGGQRTLDCFQIRVDVLDDILGFGETADRLAELVDAREGETSDSESTSGNREGIHVSSGTIVRGR